MRMYRLLLALPTAIALMVQMMSGTAGAHTEVSDSNPKNGEIVAVAPAEVWVKFGMTPMSISNGHLEVLDACGDVVHTGETSMNQTQDTLTVASGGDTAGRYEIHWFAQAIDGQEQSGFLDFEVSDGKACARSVRDDPTDDVDLGLDAVQVTASEEDGTALVKVSMSDNIACRSLRHGALQVEFDVDGDAASDLFAKSKCVKGKARFILYEPAEEADSDDVLVGSFNAFIKNMRVTLRISTGLLGDHADVFARTTFDDEDACVEKVCSDRAPDLGWLRAF
jgi:methionine-rich copper-binding protein CopC